MLLNWGNCPAHADCGALTLGDNENDDDEEDVKPVTNAANQ